MNRRHAMAAMGLGGLALTGAVEPTKTLKVSLVLPDLYGHDGKQSMPPTLRKAGFGLRFVVVVENLMAEDTYVWAEDNSEGYGTLSLEFSDIEGKKSIVHRIEKEWTKNIMRAEKLLPHGLHTRVIEYDPPAGRSSEWVPFPFADKPHEMTIRAIFEQSEVKGSKLKLWAGKTFSEGRKVMLWNT